MEQKPLARIKIQLHYPSFSSEQKNRLLCLQNRCRKPSLSTFVPFDDSQMGCCGDFKLIIPKNHMEIPLVRHISINFEQIFTNCYTETKTKQQIYQAYEKNFYFDYRHDCHPRHECAN